LALADRTSDPPRAVCRPAANAHATTQSAVPAQQGLRLDLAHRDVNMHHHGHEPRRSRSGDHHQLQDGRWHGGSGIEIRADALLPQNA
jgi:hypothetical protein